LSGRLSRRLALQSLAVLTLVCAAVYAATALGFQVRQRETLAQKEAQIRHLMTEADGGLDADALRHKLDDVLVGRNDLSLRLQHLDGTAFYEKSPAAFQSSGAPEVRFALPTSPNDGPSLQATLGLDTSSDRRLLRRIALSLIVAALAGTLLVSAGGFVLVRSGLRPVRDLVEQTRQLAADTLHQRLDGSAQPRELEPLIAQFNDLLARLGRAYEQLEGFNADVAHELGTPLANLIASTELALRKSRDADELREVLGIHLEDLHRMAGIVRDMLFLSQADRGALARRAPIESLAAVAAEVGDYHEAALDEAGLRFEVSGDAAGAFDVPLLRRALSNLIANAARHAERGSMVRTEIDVDGHRRVRLVVVNRGDPVSPEHLPRLFDRFFRVDPSRSDAARHHGLGLAIVAAIARMHAGHPIAASTDGLTSIGLVIVASESMPALAASSAPASHQGLAQG